MKWLLIGLVKLWRAFASPSYAPCCKYYPSCSSYGLEALQLHGAMKGSVLTIWRLLRCNPWSKGGVDPVPGSPLEDKLGEWWGTGAATSEMLVGPTEELKTNTSRAVVPGQSAVSAVMG